MRSKSILALILPVAFALILLSLPLHINLDVRNISGALISYAWKTGLFFKKKQKPSDLLEQKQKELYSFLQASTKKMVLASCEASVVANTLPAQENKNDILIGNVIFRTANTWNSSLWIDLGEDDNPEGCPPKIAKNSPVLSGDAVVGVVDYVGKKTSLVRLISDTSLTPSVRIARGGSTSRSLQYSIELLKELALNSKNSFEKEEEKAAFLFLLNKLSQKFPHEETLYLAKGELHGQGEPLWRGPSQLLKGVGFNYDFKDEHGPAYDLRLGTPIDKDDEYTARDKTPLLQVGDLLVTSGLDGVFPEGLKIAKVHAIFPLKEGAFSYELLAEPEAKDLSELSFVFVLPPQGFNPDEVPNHVERLLKEIPSQLKP